MPLIALLGAVALADPGRVVVTRALPPGTVLRAEDLREVDVPEVVSGTDGPRTLEQAVGRVLREPAFAGDVVLEGRLADPESGGTVAALVPRGMRLVRLPLPQASDFVPAWSWVDVYRVDGAATCTLAERVHVVAVEDLAGTFTSDATLPVDAVALHLAVRPEALAEVLATDPDDLAFVRRNPADRLPVHGGACTAVR